VVRPGDRVRALRHNFDRLGYVLTQAPDESRAIAAADEVAGRVRFEITPSGPPPAGGGRHGPHLLLVLDDDDPERILDAVGSATRHVSVLWCGGPSAAVRRRWSRRFAGSWLESEAAVKELADPPRAVVGLAPGPAARALAMRGTLPAESRSPVVPGRVVVLVAGVPWAVFDDRDPATATCRPADVSGPTASLVRRAAAAAGRAGAADGVVCCRIPDDGPIAVTHGLDGPHRALCDAVTGRDLASAAVAGALGHTVEARPPRHRAAVLRRLPAPPGRFRVAEATGAEELHADPAVTYADVPMPAGHRRTEPGPVGPGPVGPGPVGPGPVGPGPAEPGPADRIRFVVTGGDLPAAIEAADRIERALRFRVTPQDRTHVLILDRIGRAGWTRDNGTPVLPAGRFRVSVVSGRPPACVAADEFHHADVFDEALVTATVTAIHANHPIDRIACASEHLLAPAARLRTRLAVPGDSPETVRAVRDKAEMKRICRRAGIPHAPGLVVHEASEAHRLLREHGTIVVKPRDRSGAQGVRIVRDPAGLDDWLRTTMIPGTHLAEAYQPGTVCHVDAVVHEGIVAWDVSRYGEGALGFAAGRPVTSWTVADPALRDRARELLDRVLAAWRIERGVLHLEAFDAGDRLVFGELAARPGGGGIPAAFRLARGIDPRHAKLAIDAGDDPRRLLGRPAAPHAGWIVHYSPGGRLTAFDDSAVRDRAAYRELSAEIGAEVPPAAFRGTGLATYAFAAGTETEVRDLLRRASDDIRIRIQPAQTEEGRP
jgi:hypothetical protein